MTLTGRAHLPLSIRILLAVSAGVHANRPDSKPVALASNGSVCDAKAGESAWTGSTIVRPQRSGAPAPFTAAEAARTSRGLADGMFAVLT